MKRIDFVCGASSF